MNYIRDYRDDYDRVYRRSYSPHDRDISRERSSRYEYDYRDIREHSRSRYDDYYRDHGRERSRGRYEDENYHRDHSRERSSQYDSRDDYREHSIRERSRPYENNNNDDYRDNDRQSSSKYYDDDDYYKNIPEKPESKKESEAVIQEAKQDKKFWNYNEVDNSRRLQGAIDILYNSKPGNAYKVEFNDNQTGTRLIINCTTCDKILSSIDPFISHEQGKAHRKAQTASLHTKDPNLSGPLKERKLNEPRHIFAEGSLEEMIDETEKTVIGVQFSYKEIIDEETLYTCTLCERDRPVKRIKKEEMFKHLIGEYHTRKYLTVKFGFAKKSFAKLDDEALDICEFEGKIHRDITDFTNQLPDEVKWPLKGKPGTSMKKKPGSPSSSYKSSSPPRKSRHSRSPKSSRYSISPKRNQRSRSPHSLSPRRHKRSKKSRSLSPSSPVRCPPPPSIPVMVDSGTHVTPSEFCAKPLMELIELLPRPDTQPDSLELLTEDPHMQGMLITALWTLTCKADKYYRLNNATCVDSKDGKPVYMESKTNRVMNSISKLRLVQPLDEL